jgi:Na+-transporting NADH:ubiquinone oxidoreductase subunit C
VALRERQDRNALLDKQKNVLAVAGLVGPDKKLNAQEAQALFDEAIKERLIDLASGDYPADEAEVLPSYDLAKVLADETLSVEAPDNPARVERLPRYAKVYQVLHDGAVERIVLPVTGKGLWGTMNGLLAIDADGLTARGITFYEHKETPGLGGEVDNQNWKKLWDGRVAFNDAGEPVIAVVKGKAQTDSQIDGLSGATLTSRSVTNLVRFWLGEDGYGPYLAAIRKQGSGV